VTDYLTPITVQMVRAYRPVPWWSAVWCGSIVTADTAEQAVDKLRLQMDPDTAGRTPVLYYTRCAR